MDELLLPWPCVWLPSAVLVEAPVAMLLPGAFNSRLASWSAVPFDDETPPPPW
jgi:hypothetical protein